MESGGCLDAIGVMIIELAFSYGMGPKMGFRLVKG